MFDIPQDIAKEMELQEKKQLTSVIRFGDDLKGHSTLSAEDRRQIQEDIETLRENWENLTEKINWKIKRSVSKDWRLSFGIASNVIDALTTPETLSILRCFFSTQCYIKL
jgi:predicted nuclease with TOPRIM domain